MRKQGLKQEIVELLQASPMEGDDWCVYLGRQCRDTFASLKKTCRKLGVSFWAYLNDRLAGSGLVPPLADLIRQRAA